MHHYNFAFAWLVVLKIGSDRSEKLAAICRERRFQVFRADVRAIPVRDGAVDVGLCIAVIHHLSTEVTFFFILE